MTCPRCNGIGLIRKERVTRLYGDPRSVTFTSPCPRCSGKGKVAAPSPMWWQDKDESDDSTTAA